MSRRAIEIGIDMRGTGSGLSFLSRLARDVRGNTLALVAAAMMPLAGLIGGGVDMSRLYLTKTRLQQACDAGSLAGRKAMGSGAWTSGSGNGSTNDKAEKMFAANFSSGQYGTNTLIKTFQQSNGTVTGDASVIVPMTIMKIFGMESRALAVRCTAQMELPNTDVMFVLDVTLSMQCSPAATSDNCSTVSAPNRRVDGLKHAVLCFYEALERVGTPEPCTLDTHGTTNTNDDTYNSTGDPTATTASTTAQVRIGFVPYGVNVNVGKVLPNTMMADTWTYQSREAKLSTVHIWTLGAMTTPSWSGAWSGPTPTTTFFSTGNYNTFSTVGGNNTDTTPMADGRSLVKKNTAATNTTQCSNLNTYGSGSTKMVGVQETQGSSISATTSIASNNNPAVWVSNTNPNAQGQTTSHTRTNTVTTGFKYTWVSNACYLQSATIKSSVTKTYTSTENGTASKPITWSDDTAVVSGWTYKPRSLNVSGLKAGVSSWNNSVLLPISSALSGPSVTPSGSNTSQQLRHAADASVGWDGCIEEAQTVRNTDTTPIDDWGTIPSAAFDMNIDLIPNNPSTPSWYTNATTYGPGSFWGPMLAKTGSNTSSVYGAVWARYTGTNNSSWTQSAVDSTNPTTALDQDNYNYICTTSAARKLREYRTAGTAGDTTTFVGYVNSLDAQDRGTYHDIGMLWGGRLLSPRGVFASENATAPTGGAIQRHLIFMTDGVANTIHENYNAYGLSYFNRYQTSYDPSTSQTNDLTNARLLALCTAIKNENITLWVVSYGSSVDTTTQNRLRQCATPGESLTNNIHFVSATDTSALTSQFQMIAAKISQLRLTS